MGMSAALVARYTHDARLVGPTLQMPPLGTNVSMATPSAAWEHARRIVLP